MTWHRIISSDLILVIHNQSLYDIWSIKICGVSTFQFLSRMTKRNNSHHTTPASAFIWSQGIFVFITHSAVTHTEILVTSKLRDEWMKEHLRVKNVSHVCSSVLTLTNARGCAAAIVERSSPIGADHALSIVLWRRERAHWSGDCTPVYNVPLRPYSLSTMSVDNNYRLDLAFNNVKPKDWYFVLE